MRLLWTTDQVEFSRKFSYFLQKNGIEHTLEGSVDKDWASEKYGDKTIKIWIHDEDQREKAEHLLELFQKDPTDPRFSVGELPIQSSISPSRRFLERKLKSHIQDNPFTPRRNTITPSYISHFLIVFCSLLLLLDMWNKKTQDNIPLHINQVLLTTSPIKKALLFDYPQSYELLDKITSLYGYEALLKPQDLPPPGKFLFQQHVKTKSWQGVYPQFVDLTAEIYRGKKAALSLSKEEPLFEKIRQGEIWRIITPILLHGDILHLFFNMVWILLIGVQIEGRIGMPRYLGMILGVGAFSNVCQYLMTGPAFLGFSGVICGMAFFIRARQKRAPWEGYHMTTSTFHFIIFFISILAGLSCVAFVLEALFNHTFPMQIANTAHVAGACAGWVLGCSKVFQWKYKQ